MQYKKRINDEKQILSRMNKIIKEDRKNIQ